MDFDAENFDFSPDILALSGANFKAFLKERYKKRYTAKQIKEVFDRFYGKDKILHGDDIGISKKTESPSE